MIGWPLTWPAIAPLNWAMREKLRRVATRYANRLGTSEQVRRIASYFNQGRSQDGVRLWIQFPTNACRA
jgi:hypothetical protein